MCRHYSMLGSTTTASPLSVRPPQPHRIVKTPVLIGLLCITVWITCVKRDRACAHIGERLGSPLPGRTHNRVLTWENIIHALCIDKESQLSTRHAAMDRK